VENQAVMTSYCLKVVQSNQSAMNLKKSIGAKAGDRRVGRGAAQWACLMLTGCAEGNKQKRPACSSMRAFGITD
jgi:hypothetical protein